MTIQFSTDKNINGNEEFTAPYVAQIENELSRYSHQITRIEVHLSDQDGNKNGLNTMHCMIEARLEGRQPIAVNNQADTHDQAVGGAIHKLATSLDTIIGKLNNHQA
ncbi:MAG: HPF/RaiA family ribosome-associated protein [Bacteroidota bacterium]|nr:HPF/RaiA family ribosome-associated protein [Bacteroidota bacterium]